MKILAILLSLLAAASTLPGSPIELTAIPILLPDGNSPRWDMSSDELARLYPAIEKSAEKTRFQIGPNVYYSDLALSDLPVDGVIFDARFLMGPTGYLAGIQLRSFPSSVPESVKATHEKIKAHLTKEYGAPDKDGEIEPDARSLDASSRQATWAKADTIIKLEYVRSHENPPYVILEFLRKYP